MLRDDFHSDSDIDVMVQFAPNAHRGFEIVEMKQDLGEMFSAQSGLSDQKVDRASENWIR